MNPQFGTNAVAVTKRVYYTETTSTIYEGMPVCYEFDATTSMIGTIASGTKTMTIAEGSQCDGKYLRVEDLDADNIYTFAGVVKGTSYAGKLGGRWLDIYVPTGAIVPVRCDVDTTVGLTVLAITADSQELGFTATNSRPVAIAMETETGLDGTAGITLAKLDPNMFLYAASGTAALSVGTGSTFANQYVTSAITTQFLPFQIRSVLTGTGAGGLIGAKFTTGNAGTACVGDVYGLWSQASNLSDGAISGAGKLVGIWAKAHTATDSGTVDGDIFAAQLSIYNGIACGGDTAFIYFDEGTPIGETVDYLFVTYDSGPTKSCAYTADTTCGADDKLGVIKVKIGGTDMYLNLYSDTAS